MPENDEKTLENETGQDGTPETAVAKTAATRTSAARGARRAKSRPVTALEPQEEKAGKKREKKKRGKKGAIIGLIFLFLLIAALAAFLYMSIVYDFLSVRTQFIEAVNRLDPEYIHYLNRVDGLKADEDALIVREAKIVKDEERITKVRKELTDKENELNEREIRQMPIYRQPLSDQDLKDMKAVSKMYAEMNPSDAAGILIELFDNDDIAAILYYMPSASSAAIMINFDTELAAVITKILISY